MNTKFLIIGGLFVFMLVFGYWLSRLGKPYNTLILTFHKLIAVGTLVYLIVTVIKINKLAPLSPVLLATSIISLVLFLALAATGGILSGMKSVPEFVHKIHQIVPYVLILTSGYGLVRLLG